MALSEQGQCRFLEAEKVVACNKGEVFRAVHKSNRFLDADGLKGLVDPMCGDSVDDRRVASCPAFPKLIKQGSASKFAKQAK